MRKLQYLIVAIFIAISGLSNMHAQNVNAGINVQSNDFSAVTMSVAANAPEQNREGEFVRLTLPGFTTTKVPGDPALPMVSKLIEVPLGADVTPSITLKKPLKISLPLHLFPFQPSLSKSDDPDEVEFIYNPKSYDTKTYKHPEHVAVEEIGVLRDKRLFRVDICPYKYSPSENTLVVYEEVLITLTFANSDIPSTISLKKKFGSRYSVQNGIITLPTDSISSQDIITYVIVSDRMFENQLEEFINWKEQKGFKVITGYTDVIGTTTSSIKSWLQGLYDTPGPGYSPPQYLLLVGDIAQIPAWPGAAGNHKTDLYYAEFTGDIMPDIYYGRFSANSTSELQPQIDKTLQYETYTFPDPAFLDEVVMVAGADAGHSQTYGNGQINYATGYYFNADHGLLSYTYLQPEPSGANYSASIKQDVSDGVVYANYTAHCGITGWSNPSFNNSDVAALQNEGEYCLMVGNCCKSGTFASTCFGEVLLRAENKGAVGYIGGTNNTYWDEDYWWGVGVEPISANPFFHVENLGAYDRKFHDMPGVSSDDRYVTQGEMPVAGNLAVTQAGSYRTNYYWEIYTLFGDPSLAIWLSQPPAMPITIPMVMPGMTQMQISTPSDVLVAVKVNDTVADVAIMSGDGSVSMDVPEIVVGDTVIITATHYAYQPVIDTVIVGEVLSQIITLSEGWNGVSSYVNISDSITENILGQIGDTLIIMKNMTSVYWPPYAANISFWSSKQGYLIKVSDDCELELEGALSAGESISLGEGWNLMAVRSSVPVEVVSLFAGCINDLIIVKATDGSGVYWPSAGINSIGYLIPGKAYMVKVAGNCSISF